MDKKIYLIMFVLLFQMDLNCDDTFRSYQIGPRYSDYNDFENSIDLKNVSSYDINSINENPVEQKKTFEQISLKQITQQAQAIIEDAFKKFNTWIDSNKAIKNKILFQKPLDQDFVNNKIAKKYNLNENFISIDNDTKIALYFIDDALDSLGKKINASPPSLKALKDTVIKSMIFLTSKNQNKNEIIRTTVNTLKISLITPVQIAVRATTIAGGIGIGAVGGAITGAATSLYQTQKNFSEISFRNQNKKIDLTSVTKAIPEIFITSLKGIASLPSLTAYGTLTGAQTGAIIGNELAKKNVTGNLFELPENPYKKKTTSITINPNNTIKTFTAAASDDIISIGDLNSDPDKMKELNILNEVNKQIYTNKVEAQFNAIKINSAPDNYDALEKLEDSLSIKNLSDAKIISPTNISSPSPIKLYQASLQQYEGTQPTEAKIAANKAQREQQEEIQKEKRLEKLHQQKQRRI